MIGTSTQSRTASEGVSNAVKRQILAAKYGHFDFLFPLFDAICQETRIPYVFYLIHTIFQLFQFTQLSNWAYLVGYLDPDKRSSPAFYVVLNSIVLFVGGKKTVVDPMVFFIVISLVFDVLFLSIIIQLISYHRTRTYSKAFLHVIRFIIEIIAPVFIIPTCSYIGWMLQEFINNTYSSALAFMLVSLVYYIVFVMIFAVTFRILSVSPFLSTSLISMWNSKHYSILIIMQSVFAFLSCFIDNFPSFMVPATIALHMLFMAYQGRNILYYYFVNLKMVDILASSVISAAFVDILSIIAYYWVKITPVVMLITQFSVFSVVIIVEKIVTKRRMSTLASLLGTPLPDAETAYEEMNIKFNPDIAMMYLHIGIAEHCDRILDFSFQKYLVGNCDSIDVFADLVKTTCLFPQESRFLSHLFQAFLSKRSPSFAHRFMLYQTERIKAVRQCSSSIDSGEMYSRVQSLTQTCFDEIMGFWRRLPQSTSSTSAIMNDIRKADNQWIEILSAFPNNNRFKEEYSRFLIECKSDFSGGILQKYYAQQIEQGATFATDKSFRYFIRTFPVYLKKNIMDFKGNIIVNLNRKKGSTSSSSHASDSGLASNSSSQISAEVEENIGKSLLGMSKTRLAIQNAFYNRKSTPLFFFLLTNIFFFVILLCSSLIIFLILSSKYESHILLIVLQDYLGDNRNLISSSEFYSYLKWAEARQMLVDSPYPVDGEDGFNFTQDSINGLINKSMESLTVTLSQSLKGISYRTILGDGVSKTAKPFINSQTPSITCHGAKPLKPISVPFSVSEIQLYYNLKDVKQFTTSNEYPTSEPICEIVSNTQPLFGAIDNITESNSQSLKVYNTEMTDSYAIYMNVFCLSVAIVTAIPLFISMTCVFREQRKMVRLMRSFSDVQRQDALKPIVIDSCLETQQTSVVELDDKTECHFLAYFLIFIGALVLPIFESFEISGSRDYMEKFDTILSWISLSSSRKSFLIEGVSALTLGSILSKTGDDLNPSSFLSTTANLQFTRTSESFNQASLIHKSFIMGSSKVPSVRGVTDEIDNINTAQACSIVDTNETAHTFFKCASLTQQLQYLQSIVTSEINNSVKFGDFFFSVSHGVFVHIAPKIDKSTDLLIEYSTKLKQSHNHQSMAYFVGCALGSIIMFCILYYVGTYYQKLYFTLLHLILRIPPTVISCNTELLNYLMKKNTAADTTGSMTLTMKILHGSNDAIICTGTSDDIEITNKAVTKLFGYTPEQILGQNYAIIFDDEASEEVTKQMAIMRNGQVSHTYESHVLCISDNNSQIACKLTLVGMCHHDETKATSFVIILTDETDLLKKQELAEAAKKKSENLLNQILPMDIVLRLNRGEKNIAFTIPFATIIFIDVQRFSEYASSLTPSQIMGALSTLFVSFDDLVTRYDSITKIKLVGDKYMAAGGLFSPEEPPAKPAEQVVRFALDILSEIDEVNNQLGANLNLRIGINSGGPIIGGVLGTDKPAFDIVGDAINVADRMQAADLPGRVQISQATYDLVSSLEASFEKRGEILLKGKGAVAYLVTQTNSFSVAFSSSAIFPTSGRRGSTSSVELLNP